MKYFTISELTKSNTAKAYHIDNTPDAKSVDNMEILINDCLDRIREMWGRPIYVNSGYRCKELNIKVKGKKTSHHLKGMAADITTHDIDKNKELFEMIKNSDIPFTQLIDESDYLWVHISYDKKNLKRQVLHL